MHNFKKYYYKEDYFEFIDTEEKAYFLGLICADGCVNINEKQWKYSLVLSQSEKDKDILYKFMNAICLNEKPIYTYQDKKPNSQLTYIFQLNSKKITRDLCNLGVTPNKTKILKFPIINENLNQHLIRGYFDGDGSVWWSSNKLFINFAGSELFIDKIQIILNQKINFNFTKKIYHNGIWYCQYSGNKQINRFYNYLYENSNIFYERKKIKFIKNPLTQI